jgi:hypothetical protein
VTFLRTQKNLTVPYFFCGSKESNLLSQILRVLVHELLRSNPDLVVAVHETYLQKNATSTSAVLATLMREICPGIANLRLILDGLDECEEQLQSTTVKFIVELRKLCGGSFKVLISSRELPQIDRQLRPKTSVTVHHKTSDSIKAYIHQGVADLRESFRYVPDSLVDRLELRLLEKAGGGF